MTRAALYLRQSLDRDKTELGIDRQRERCSALAAARGWDVVAEFVDNDVSATKPRGPKTAWHGLISGATSGDFDVIVAVDVDRLLRTLSDLVTLNNTGAKIATVDGEIDLTSADGEFRATMAAGLARFEGRRKAERQRRANQQRREAGIPKSGRTPFGYSWVSAAERRKRGTDAAYDIVPEEAQAIRDSYAALLAGVSLGQICRDLTAAGTTTKTGSHWRPSTLRRVLQSPFYAALIPEPNADGSPYDLDAITRESCHPGAWEAIVGEETWLAAKEVLGMAARRTNGGRTARKWLLSGLAVCGVCFDPVRAGGGDAGIHSYRCRSMAHFMRRGVPLDRFVESVIVARLSRPDALDLLIDRDRPDADALRVERLGVSARLDNVVNLVADGTLTSDNARAAIRSLREELAAIDSKMTEAGRVDVLGDIVGSPDVAVMWESLPLDRKRAVLDTLMTVVVHSVGQGGRSQTMERMAATTEIIWKE
jgi:site-specific DNA recombinase